MPTLDTGGITEAASIDVSETELTLWGLEDTVQLSWVVRDADGVEIPDATVSWNTGDSEVVQVSSDGQLTPQGAGETSVVVSSDNGQARAFINVTVRVVLSGLVFICRDSESSNICGLDTAYGAVPFALTDLEASHFGPRVSPDGTKIVFRSTRGGGNHIFVMDVDGSNVVQLTHNEAANREPTWSPDGTQIAYVHDSMIAVMDADGTHSVDLLEGSQPHWSPLGDRIAFTRRGHILTISPEGEGLAQLTAEVGGSAPRWSPDGTRIAFAGRADVFVMDADGRNPINLTNDNYSWAHDPAWSPDGRKIAYTFSQLDDQAIYMMDSDGSNQVPVVVRTSWDSAPDWVP